MASVEALVDLLAKAREKTRSLVVEAEGRFTAVGDIHGDYRTLGQILEEWESPYLFLGDYVDRGDMGLEVVAEVLKLYVEGKAVVLRGNHESPVMNIEGGFLDELCEKIGSRCGAVYKEFEKTFASLPVAAVVNGKIVALHGGIPLKEDMTPASLEDLRRAGGDLVTPADPLVFQALWNDPCPCDTYAPSPRGPGAWLFGRKITKEFHAANDTAVLLRGHTYVPAGCAVHHGGAVVTVFTSAVGPYRKTKPKVAAVRQNVEVYDLSTKEPARCPEDPDLL
ncbi:metallophosphoesterase family protein [Pyrobaculum neutrophilum]|uniref:Bis(5'nucleosyl)-tetraphosphatase, ApaH n=1 Tax=Pyrobaculum neutrophilum (strain DSM 2338 / JCM 9278 / NBRC 100436 / V24Sta) TaxID=444157 RepID=B1Y8Z2_PYRNV|nr:metallophosphoesterase family protein [Pyrobaculum neutrophilum]ACB40221.1 bis(5'nucleosyl)-tetraphosphatase, ApaH [Pyrobaculum neutrophilum V24Sta]